MVRMRFNTIDRLTPATQEALASIATHSEWRDGEVLHREGELARAVLVLEEGRLRISRLTRSGTEHLRRWLRVGETVCLSSVVAAEPFPFSVIADGRCRTTQYETERFLGLMRQDSRIAMEFASFLARRVIEFSAALDDQEASLSEMAYATLLRLSKVGNGIRRADGIELRISQRDLACMVGTSRQYLSPQLHLLQSQGYIRVGYRTITVLDSALPRVEEP